MVSSHGCFVWYELTTTDAEAAKAFYADVVGWGLRDASMPGAAYTLFTAGVIAVAGLTGLPAEARRRGGEPRRVADRRPNLAGPCPLARTLRGGLGEGVRVLRRAFRLAASSRRLRR